MKNITTKISVLTLLLLSSTFSSCDKDFEKINTDPIGTPTTTANQLLAPALVNIMNANMLRNRNLNNELMQVTVDISDADGRVFRYDLRRNLSDQLWNAWYQQLTNLKDVYTIATEPANLNKSYQGISLIAQSWVFSLLTDTYGDIPYSEATQGRNGNVEPVFNRQKDIYLNLFDKLEEANTLLSEGDAIIAAGDPVYEGDIAKWRKLGNSLYLRFLLRVSGKSEVSSIVTAKIKEIVDNPVKYPIMQDNEDTANIEWNGTNNSTAAFTSPFMVNVRAADFRAPSLTSFFLHRVRDWNYPPVLPRYGASSIPRWGIAQAPKGGYVGIPSGFGVGQGFTRQSYFYSDTQNSPFILQTDRYTGIIMNASEVNFILAEAAAKGWISGPAEAYYNKGILYGINYWVRTYPNDINNQEFKDYVTGADIEWDESLPLDAPTGTSKMEMIHVQKYYGMFLVDLQQWFEYRRTGHPILPKGDGLMNGGIMPARLNYPALTQSANPTNYKEAVAAQGPDLISTQVWWQKP